MPQGSQETAFAKNAMGMDAMQNTRVPLEIRQNEGQAFTISIADMDLPEDIYVYLEDTLNGTTTLLQEKDFELTTQDTISEAGRFYIHLTTNVLGNEDRLNTALVNVYKGKGNDFITIEGLKGEALIKLYTILGKEVGVKVLTTSNETLSTYGLSSGIYIIQLNSNNQLITKKIQID